LFPMLRQPNKFRRKLRKKTKSPKKKAKLLKLPMLRRQLVKK